MPLLVSFFGESKAQTLVSTLWGDYVPGTFPGYGEGHPDAAGFFYGQIAISPSGLVESGTAYVVLTLAPEVPWDGTAITAPDGWELDPSSTPTNLLFINTRDLTDADEPVFEIPVRAIAPRSSTVISVGAQIFNAGGDWELHPDAPDKFTAVQVEDVNLPVVLTTFTAIAEGPQVNLRWSTTQETNSDRFEVERSAKGKDWLKIGVVKSHGESTVLRNYPFTDEVPLAGTNYYRLKMVDLDGSYEYSRMVSVEFTGDVAGVYPNPSTGRFRLNEKVLVGSIELTDASGYVIPAHRYQVGQDNHVEAESLPSGLYLLKVKQTNGTTTIHKLVIAR